jgi:hypothetical protein
MLPAVMMLGCGPNETSPSEIIFFPTRVGGVFAFRAEDRYVSSGVVRFTLAGHADGDRQLALDRFRQMEQEILSRKSLTEIITQPALDLYDEDRKTTPLGEVVDNMRRVLSIKPAQLPSGRIATFVISCEYPDKFKAQSVVRELVVKFIEQNITTQRSQPPSAAAILEVQDPASLPERSFWPNRPMIISIGLLGGAVLGLLALLLWGGKVRLPKNA